MKKRFNKIDIPEKLSEIYPIKVIFEDNNYIYDFSKYSDNQISRWVSKLFFDKYRILKHVTRYNTYFKLLDFLLFLKNRGINKIEELEPINFIDYASYLNTKKSSSISKYEIYAEIKNLIESAKKENSTNLINFTIPTNPFSNKARVKNSDEKLNAEQLKEILKVCYEKIDTSVSYFREIQQKLKKIEKDLNGGATEKKDELNSIYYFYQKYKVIPLEPFLSNTERSIAKRVGGIQKICEAISPDANLLLPFYLVLLIELAANADPIRLIKMDCIEEDPLFEDRCFIVWDKGRATQQQKRNCLKNKKYGAYQITKLVEELTKNIRDVATEDKKEYLFLFRSALYEKFDSTKLTRKFELALIHFVKNNFDFQFGLKNIRQSVLTEMYRKRKDITSVSKIANHKDINTTLTYVADDVTREENRFYLANKQDIIIGNIINKRDGINNANCLSMSASEAIGFNCKNPIVNNKVCINWMQELTNPNLIIIDDEKYLSRILRLKEDLLMAKKLMNQERFDLLYAPTLALIENEIFPKFSISVVKKSEKLARELNSIYLGDY